MFYGDGLVPAVVGWLVLPRVGLPSSGERGQSTGKNTKFLKLVVNWFGSTSLLCLFIFSFTEE